MREFVRYPIKTGDPITDRQLELMQGALERDLDKLIDVWDDIRFPAEKVKPVGSFPAQDGTYQAGYVIDFSEAKDQKVSWAAQIPHDYKEGSDIEFHIHAIGDVGAGDHTGTVKWTFTYTWANVDATVQNYTEVTASTDISQTDKHLYLDIDDITGIGKTISSMLLCSLTRNGTSVNDDFTSAVHLLEADFHYEKDSNGSQYEEAK